MTAWRSSSFIPCNRDHMMVNYLLQVIRSYPRQCCRLLLSLPDRRSGLEPVQSLVSAPASPTGNVRKAGRILKSHRIANTRLPEKAWTRGAQRPAAPVVSGEPHDIPLSAASTVSSETQCCWVVDLGTLY